MVLGKKESPPQEPLCGFDLMPHTCYAQLDRPRYGVDRAVWPGPAGGEPYDHPTT